MECRHGKRQSHGVRKYTKPSETIPCLSPIWFKLRDKDDGLTDVETLPQVAIQVWQLALFEELRVNTNVVTVPGVTRREIQYILRGHAAACVVE